MDNKSIERSIRCIVSQSDVNVITKRMVRAEYMKQHSLSLLKPALETAINKILHTIIQELSDLLKQGKPLESLRLNDDTDVQLEPINISKRDDDKSQSNKNSLNLTQKDLTRIEYDRSKSNLSHKKSEIPSQRLEIHKPKHRNQHKHLFTAILDSKANIAKSVKQNRLPKYFSVDEARESILNSDDSQLSCDSICSERLLPDRAEEVFSNWENDVDLLESESSIVIDKNCDHGDSKSSTVNGKDFDIVDNKHSSVDGRNSGSVDFTTSRVNGRGCYKVDDSDCVDVAKVKLLLNDSDCDHKELIVNDSCYMDSRVKKSDCNPMDIKVSDNDCISPIASKNDDIIVIDSSPEVGDRIKKSTMKTDNNRNWLSVFSEEDVKALITDNLSHCTNLSLLNLAANEDCSSERLTRVPSDCKPSLPLTVLKTGVEQVETGVIDTRTSPPKKKQKTSLSCGKRRLLVSDHSFIASKTTDMNHSFFKNSQSINRNIFKETSPLDGETKSVHRGQSLWVRVLYVPQDASYVENIIDVTQ